MTWSWKKKKWINFQFFFLSMTFNQQPFVFTTFHRYELHVISYSTNRRLNNTLNQIDYILNMQSGGWLIWTGIEAWFSFIIILHFKVVVFYCCCSIFMSCTFLSAFVFVLFALHLVCTALIDSVGSLIIAYVCKPRLILSNKRYIYAVMNNIVFAVVLCFRACIIFFLFIFLLSVRDVHRNYSMSQDCNIHWFSNTSNQFQ